MSNKSQYEDRGIRNTKSCYTKLEKTWEYSCPIENTNYVGFNRRGNGLCIDMPMKRSSGDRYTISGKEWSIGNPDLGWKK
jgi:hypothetical protein